MTDASWVLIVEDDTDIRDGLRELLEQEGFTVRTSANGHEAWEQLIGSGLPRLIVLDLLMPGLNGGELYRRLRNTPGLAAVPVVVVTAAPSMSPPGIPMLPKPFTTASLVDMVRQHCRW